MEGADDERAGDEGADNKEVRCDEDEGLESSIHVMFM